MKISKGTWKEIENILKKHKIPFTVHYESYKAEGSKRKIGSDEIMDKHIQINVVIPDWFDELIEEE